MGKTSAQRGETDTGLLPQQTHWGLCELGRQGRKWRRLPRTPSSVSASTGQARPLKTHWRQGRKRKWPRARCQQVGKKLLAQKQTDFGSSRDVRATEPISVRTSLRSYKHWLLEECPLHHHQMRLLCLPHPGLRAEPPQAQSCCWPRLPTSHSLCLSGL